MRTTSPSKPDASPGPAAPPGPADPPGPTAVRWTTAVTTAFDDVASSVTSRIGQLDVRRADRRQLRRQRGDRLAPPDRRSARLGLDHDVARQAPREAGEPRQAIDVAFARACRQGLGGPRHAGPHPARLAGPEQERGDADDDGERPAGGGLGLHQLIRRPRMRPRSARPKSWCFSSIDRLSPMTNTSSGPNCVSATFQGSR